MKEIIAEYSFEDIKKFVEKDLAARGLTFSEIQKLDISSKINNGMYGDYFDGIIVIKDA